MNNSQVYFEPYQKMIYVRQNLVELRPGWGQTRNGHIPGLRSAMAAQCSGQLAPSLDAGLPGGEILRRDEKRSKDELDLTPEV